MSRNALVTRIVAQKIKANNSEKSLAHSRDFVAQAYSATWGDLKTVRKVRNRVHWITSQVFGSSVLDVGTSEGIVPILLGREGFNVVGIDINPDAIAYANEMLRAESEVIQERVQFRNVSLFQDAMEFSFDTVIIGEVLEHVGNVENFLKLAMEHLKDGGRLVITTPFGVFPDRDHKHTFFLSDIHEKLKKYGNINHLDVSDGYIRAVLEKKAGSGKRIGPSLLEILEKTEQGAFEAQVELWQRLDDLNAKFEESLLHVQEVEQQKAVFAETVEKLRTDNAQLLKSREENADLFTRLEVATQNLRNAEIQHRNLETQIDEFRELSSKERTDRSAEYDAVAHRLEAMMAERDQLEKEQTDLKATLVKKDKRLSEFAAQQQKLTEKCQALHTELDECREQQLVLEVELQQGAQERETVQDELVKLTAEYDSVANRLEKTSFERDQLKVAQTEMHASLSELEASNAQSMATRKLMDETVRDPRMRSALGFALLEAGQMDGAAAFLEDLPHDMPLSSREESLLAALRAFEDGNAQEPFLAGGPRSRLRVCTIMDEFTYNCFAPECDLMQLSVDHWENELQAFAPHLLFIESAWRGKSGQWGSKVGHLSSELQGILSWCKDHDVPTVFWNKEDPVHFETFLTLASKVDAVFTTDIDCIATYKARLGHDSVYFMPFGCQPDVHNPIELYERKDAFCFAGAYYTRYPQRTRDLEEFVDVLPGYKPLEIYDRNFGKDHPDYMFPESYQPFIVGTLAPTEIDKAYKGYRFGINLNSVKGSQSMFARRVYELLASNTITVSNFSRGLRQMFGDLVVSTDSGQEVLDRVRQIDECQGARLQLAGLRKVLTEHTYTQRFAYLTSKLGLEARPGVKDPAVTVLAAASNAADAERLLVSIEAQAAEHVDMVLVLGEEIDLASLPEVPCNVTLLSHIRAAELSIADIVPAGSWVAGFVAGDHYGAHYLTDLLLATSYVPAGVLCKDCHFRLSENADGMEMAEIDGRRYGCVEKAMLRRAMLQVDLVQMESLTSWLDALPLAEISEVEVGNEQIFAIDPFNYCEAGAANRKLLKVVRDAVDDLPELNCGIPMAKLLARAERTLPAPNPEVTDPVISGADLAASIPPVKDGCVSWAFSDGSWEISSSLADGKHVYLTQSEEYRLEDLSKNDQLKLYLETSTGLHLYLVAFFLDLNKQKIDHAMLAPNKNHAPDVPEGTVWVRFALRVYASGFGSVQRLILGTHKPVPMDLVANSAYLVLTNHYPSYDNLYRNAFVHSRVIGYLEAGVNVDVYRLRAEQSISYHEFSNVDCITGSAEQLDHMLASGQYKHVLVHFLDLEMWAVLKRHLGRVKVTVWVHGAEIQPWWRRSFNYTTEIQLEAAKADSALRMDFWKDVLSQLDENFRLVFVSQTLVQEVCEDLSIGDLNEKSEVIHNPIDGKLFSYVPKSVEQRKKILSIRPFATAKYANDLTVEAILMLRDQPFFDDLEFRIIGEGVLFEELTQPLKGLANVHLEKRFLAQDEIAQLHKEYGVFLNPTRWDSQGVSRDEAMCSGLVPVTSAVAAVPEFVDETCGYLAALDDAAGLAEAIAEMYENPEVFLQKSEAAAMRVRQQSRRCKIIQKELSSITGMAT